MMYPEYVGPTPKHRRYQLIKENLQGDAKLKEVVSNDCRKQSVVLTRWLVWTIMHKYWHYPTTRIGDIWGMDHSTVINGLTNYRRVTNGRLELNNYTSSNRSRLSPAYLRLYQAHCT